MPHVTIHHHDGEYEVREHAEEEIRSNEADGVSSDDVVYVEDAVLRAWRRHEDEHAAWSAHWRAIDNEQHAQRRLAAVRPLEDAERKISELMTQATDLQRSQRYWQERAERAEAQAREATVGKLAEYGTSSDRLSPDRLADIVRRVEVAQASPSVPPDPDARHPMGSPSWSSFGTAEEIVRAWAASELPDHDAAEIADVWCELRSAYLGVNGYGGHTAEIYAYRLLPTSVNPRIADRLETPHATTSESASATICRSLTGHVLAKVARCLQERVRDAEFFVSDHGDGVVRVDLDSQDFPSFDHRIHVQVAPRSTKEG
jgi:hypothetical protein